jgi:hypothetical protein
VTYFGAVPDQDLFLPVEVDVRDLAAGQDASVVVARQRNVLAEAAGQDVSARRPVRARFRAGFDSLEENWRQDRVDHQQIQRPLAGQFAG